MLIRRVYGKTFAAERNVFKDLQLQTWAVSKYMKQGEELNNSGELFIRRNPKLKVKLVDGSSLAIAVVLNSIPRARGTTQVAFKGNFNKIASYLALALCQKGIQVVISREKDYEMLKSKLTSANNDDKLVFSSVYSQKTWLVGEGLTKEEQMKASKGTLIIPYSQFPPTKVRKDCFYDTTPSMLTPKYLANVDSCEPFDIVMQNVGVFNIQNWLPRRVMSSWRIASILHGLEGWNVNECGNEILDIDKVWDASIRHGFSPTMKSFT
ncbi:hypothetical protein L1987_21381 [Smallanthus sonchifolius]|uniref:Uncharacterized protein n=1 Tax=Smallanthus sonchifolius TaxID=185202 RepID=A0ACB9IUQ9_9ASTR|nr:hypothetical protein L1987_21381 [Smallanthus sonchifolius]